MHNSNQQRQKRKIFSLKSKLEKFIYLASEENMTFFQMLMITFVITLCMTFVIALIVFDNNQNVMNQGFRFSMIPNLDGYSYLFSTTIQTIVPTTITFSGTILILQSRSHMNRTYKVLLFISIILLALFGVMQSSVKTVFYLSFTNIVLFFLVILSIFFSKKIFNLNSSINKKNETSDGTPVA